MPTSWRKPPDRPNPPGDRHRLPRSNGRCERQRDDGRDDDQFDSRAGDKANRHGGEAARSAHNPCPRVGVAERGAESTRSDQEYRHAAGDQPRAGRVNGRGQVRRRQPDAGSQHENPVDHHQMSEEVPGDGQGRTALRRSGRQSC